MKKLFTLICAAMLCVGANAQIVTSTSQEITTRAPKAPSKGITYMRGGFNANTMSGEGIDHMLPTVKPGYDFAFGFQKYFGKSPLYWGMEYGLTSRGTNLTDMSISLNNGHTTWDTGKIAQHGFKLQPFQFGYHPMWGNSFQIGVDAHIGVQMSVWYYGTYTADNYELLNESQYDWENSDGLTYISASLPIGVGIWITKHFNIDYTCEIGLTPGSFGNKGREATYVNHLLRLGVGF